MEIKNAFSLIEVLVDHNQQYPLAVRQQLLEAVCEIADACLQTLDLRANGEVDQQSRYEIENAARLLERNLMKGELTEGFLLALEYFHRAALQAGRCEAPPS